jgi:cell division protein FtsI/penicillin-binding protein 2
MGALIRKSIVGHVLAVAALAQSPDTLFRTTADAVLKRDFADSRTAYVLLDARKDLVLSSMWLDRDTPVPFGSLLKAFVAIAYAADHGSFPVHTCHGTADHCWLPRGHGSLGLEQALAHSCNAYFLALARNVSLRAISQTAAEFGLQPPPLDRPETLIGLDSRWRNSPLQLARAYRKLLAMRKDAVPQRIFMGMAMAADDGTGEAIRASDKPGRALIKTGTAKCIHPDHAAGDGFALAMWPAEAPRYVLLVRRHGEPGSRAAQLAGHMVETLERGARVPAD